MESSPAERDRSREWLETDGLGGFASGTVAGPRSRRYHALLLAATTPPTGRVVLVNGFDASIATEAGTWALSSQHYAADVIHPDGAQRVVDFGCDPWPRWTFALADGSRIELEIWVPKGGAVSVLRWVRTAGRGSAVLTLRPFLSGRDYHSLHHENPAFRFEPDRQEDRLIWRPYPGIPGIVCASNATYNHEPSWYRNFVYREERERGLDCVEDLASPGILQADLAAGEVVMIFAAEGLDGGLLTPATPALSVAQQLRASERARRRRLTRGLAGSEARLRRAADAYFVARGDGKTIVAGYPWFTDWGRDTFIAARGLGLATGRLDEVRAIVSAWAGSVSRGMLPNRFPDSGGEPEFNSVDASLWYVVLAYELLEALRAKRRKPARDEESAIWSAIDAILSGYSGGTRFGIRADSDGLLACGEPGVQLTWMDAKVGDWVVTPRIGKPVEVQALWLNGLRIGATRSEGWATLFERARRSFAARFWNEAGGCLYDVVDVDHQPGTSDAVFRPNQILAAGGLPFALVEGERARRLVDAVEAKLWTRCGLRSLAPGESGYRERYEGGVRERDGAYHQGTVWPWLLGPFVEAWVRVRGDTGAARREARQRFLEPLLTHLDEAGVDHVSEITDATEPYRPRGCPFQAWSVGEALRLHTVLRTES